MDKLPEIIFASSKSTESRRIKKLLEKGQLKPLIPRVYTSILDEKNDEIVKRNIWLLVSHIFPDAMLSHRSALEFRISPKNNLYLTARSRGVYR